MTEELNRKLSELEHRLLVLERKYRTLEQMQKLNRYTVKPMNTLKNMEVANGK